MANEVPGVVVDGALKGLLDVYHKRKQAELNLEKARATEAMEGRAAVPRVVAQLRAMREKEAAKRQKIAKQGEGQQQDPAQMLPPEVPVTGLPRPKGDLSSLIGLGSQAAGIAQQVGGGPQPAGQGGAGTPVVGGGMQAAGAAGNIGAQMAMGQMAAPAAAQAGVPQAQPTPAPTQGAPGTVPAGAPGSLAVVRQPLEWWERALGAVGGVGAIANRNFLGAVQQFEEVIRGEREIGRVFVPTTQEQAQEVFVAARTEAQTLAPLVRELEDAAGTDRAGDVGAELVRNVNDIIKRRGPAVGLETIRQSQLEVRAQRQDLKDRVEAALGSAYVEEQKQIRGEQRREAIAAKRPGRMEDAMRFQFVEDEALRRETSTFNGQTFTAEERRRWLDEQRKLTPGQIFERQIYSGIDLGTPAPQAPAITQEQATEAARKFWEANGRNPTDEELRGLLGLD